MGKLVSFWSPYAGHGKATSSLCSIIGGFVLQYPEVSLAVSHMKKDSIALLGKLDSKAVVWKEKGLLDGFGMEALKMYSRQRALSLDSVRRCGLPLYDKTVLFYPNFTGHEPDDAVTFQILTEQLKKEFQLVFFDLESGNKDVALQYMQVSDYVVIVLPQDPLYAESFLKEDQNMNNINYGIIFGGCFRNSKYSSTYYRRKYEKRMNSRILGEILWNADFFDAMSAGKTLDFFQRNNTPVKNEENYEFIVQTKKAAERINKILFC